MNPVMPLWHRILVPTDFSECSDSALSLATRIAEQNGAEIFLLHVVELAGGLNPGMTVHAPGELAGVSLEDYARNGSITRLEEQAARVVGSRVPVAWAVVFGKPEESIPAAVATRSADLIVMGSHGRTGLAHLFLGSVAEKVIRASPVPVLTFRATATAEQPVASEPVVIPGFGDPALAPTV